MAAPLAASVATLRRLGRERATRGWSQKRRGGSAREIDVDMSGQAFRFAVRVKTGAKREEVGGRWQIPADRLRPAERREPATADGPQEREAHSGSALIVAVTAAAVEGKANEAVRRAIARAFGVRRQGVRLVSGERGRDKLVELDPAPAGAPERLAALLGSASSRAAAG